MKAGGRGGGKRLYLALLHFPVYDKNGRVVTACITILDLHDVARLARTYGVGGFLVVHPVASQRALVRRIVHHWTHGFGARYNATRREAFETLTLCSSLDEAVYAVQEREGGRTPRLVVTTAGRYRPTVGFVELSRRLRERSTPHLLLLGTGWGLAREVVERADDVLEPVAGGGDYNHLSVRSAAAVVVDRLLSEARAGSRERAAADT